MVNSNTYMKIFQGRFGAKKLGWQAGFKIKEPRAGAG